MKRIILLIYAILILLPAVNARTNHITLLAVTDQEFGYKGVAADLVVRIEPGTGRVFVDTFPLSKIDTQISIRFAKEIACQFSTKDCSEYDFFYTIRSSSAIIAGPSAGAALASITLATLENENVNPDVSMTGTINAGGLIGPVSGVKEKIEAAKSIGITTVLIPAGSAEFEKNNESFNFTEYGKNLSVKAVEVLDLHDAMKFLTGKEMKQEPITLQVDPQYTQIMQFLSESLCNRTEYLENKAKEAGVPANNSFLIEAKNSTARARQSRDSGQQYSSASFCFTSNVRIETAVMLNSNLSKEQVYELINETRKDLLEQKEKKRQYKTITDLETFFLVNERITETEQRLNQSISHLDANNTYLAVQSLAFANERLLSSKAWRNFFGITGKELKINEASLQGSCANKLAEAEERLQYLDLFLPQGLADARKTLTLAYANYKEGEFEQCLFDASKAKAQADAVLSVIGVPTERMQQILGQKARVVEHTIAMQMEKGNFPIAGYSYYEYANSLRSFDAPSALLFYQYSMELSNLDVYFDEKNPSIKGRIDLEQKDMRLFSAAGFIGVGIMIGFGIGVFATAAIVRQRQKRILKNLKKRK